MIRGVLFDMDGVILDSERMGRGVYLAECARLGYPQVDEALYEQLIGKNEAEDRRIMKAALGEDFPFEEMHAAYRAGLYALAEAGRLPLKPGVEECFRGLKARGIRIALATSTQREQVERYQAQIPAMRDVFDAMVCGREAPSKPAPDIYLSAAAKLGLRPEECLGVEDSVAGLQSLTAAGAGRVLIPDLLPCDGRYAGLWDHCLTDLLQLCPLIDRLNAAQNP